MRYMGHHDYEDFLSVASASLGTTFPTGSSSAASASIAVEGTQRLEADTATVFDPVSASTSIDYQFQCSNDDGDTWLPVAGRFAEDGVPADALVVENAVGTTVRKKLFCDSHSGSSLTRLVARRAGVTSGTDAAVCTRLRVVGL